MSLSKKITRTRLKAFLKRHASSQEEKVLDIGASESAYRTFFPNAVTLDIEENKNPDVVGDVHDLPLGDGEFDVVLCTEVLEHVHSPEKAIQEMHRVLKPGGKIILTTRFVFPIHDAPYDYYRYTPYGLQHLFKDWKNVVIENETNTAETIAVLFQTLAWKGSFRGGKVGRALVLILAWLAKHSSWFIREERTSGRYGQKRVLDSIMSSGYYVVAEK